MAKKAKIEPKIPTVKRKKSSSVATINKKKQPKKKKNIKVPDNISTVAAYTKSRIDDNENILKLFPDVEIAMQILISNILSPNDMLNVKLNYIQEDFKLPNEVNSLMLDILESFISKNYRLEHKLFGMLKESLFTKGAYIKTYIPAKFIEDLENTVNGEGEITIEDANNKLVNNGLNILSNADAIEVSTENHKEYFNMDKIEVKNEDLDIVITDNISVLPLKDKMLTKVSIDIDSKLDIGLESLTVENFRQMDNKINENKVVNVRDDVINDDSRSESLSPYELKLPVESVIPIHALGEPENHIGYFVILNENGTPITSRDVLKTNDVLFDQFAFSKERNNVISKAKNALMGATKKDVKLSNVENLYIEILESNLSKRVNDGMLSNLVEIEHNKDMYKLAFHRSLKNLKTQFLFIPANLVVYYAFEFRDNGTGRSLLEKANTLFSMRSILLFSNLMGSVKNSIPSTDIKVKLDDDDDDPESTMEQVMSNILKTRQMELPVGINNVNDIVDWIHKVGFKFNFKHPDLPDMEIDINDTNRSFTLPDDTLSEKIEEYITMSFGLTKDMVKVGYDPEYATIANSNNLLFAKRTMQTQAILDPLITKDIRIITKTDLNISNKLKYIIKNNIKKIRKKILKNLNEDDKDIKNNLKNDDYVVEYVYYNFIKSFRIELPKPEVKESTNLKELYENYVDVVDNYLDNFFSSDALPEEIAGIKLSENIDSIRAAFKTVIIKNWMSKNGYIDEINEFLTLDDDGKPTFDILDDFNTHIELLGTSIIDFIKKNKKLKDSLDNKLEKAEGEEDEEENMNNDETPADNTEEEGINNPDDEEPENPEEPTDGQEEEPKEEEPPAEPEL